MKDKKPIDIPVDKIMDKMPSNDKYDKVGIKIIGAIVIIVVFAVIVFAGVMANALAPVDKRDSSRVEFKVESGWGSSTVLKK